MTDRSIRVREKLGSARVHRGRERRDRTRVRLAVTAALVVLGAGVTSERPASAEETSAPSTTALNPATPATPLGPGPADSAPNDALAPPILPEAPIEVPPPPPRHKGLVLDTGLGGLQFVGQFKHVAPLAPWAYTQLGYELWRWLMVYGYGELSFMDTSVAEDETHARAFPVFGFGAGLRFTVHATERVALFLQGAGGAMQADVPKGALTVLGFAKAESLGLTLGGRLGVEWYQVDRHLALGLGVGFRDAMGFQKTFGPSDTPLAIDATASIRYTF